MTKSAHRIPSRGVTVVKTLNYGHLLLEKIVFDAETLSREHAACLEQLFDLMVRIAALCSGNDTWLSTYQLLIEAGVDVPQQYCYDRMYLDKLLDEDLSMPKS